MKIPISGLASKARFALLLAIAVLVTVGSSAFMNRAEAATCPPPAADYGSVTNTVSIPAAATYRIWTHMKVADSTNDTYMIEVDGKECFNVGGTGLQANAWHWVAHQNGNSAARTDLQLSQGNHTIKLIGNKPGVRVDRVVFAADLACVPNGDGANCDTPQDTTVPTVQLTAPTPNTTVSGTVAVKANASDNTSVTKVEFSVNGAVVATDTSAPYSFNWDTTAYTNKQYSIGVEAFDGAGNSAQDSFTVTVQNGDKQAPTAPTGVLASAIAHNKVAVSWKASSDNIGVAKYTVYRNDLPVATLGGTVLAYDDTAVTPNTSYTYKVQALDAAGNKSPLSSTASVKTPNVADTQAPSTPGNVKATATSSNQINLTWSASNDNIAVVGYDVYRDNNKVASVQGTSFGDANLKPNTTYKYFVKARDGAGNQSSASSQVSAKTTNKQKRGVISGTVKNDRTKRPVAHAAVVVHSEQDKRTRIYIADKNGKYHTGSLAAGKYKLTYYAWDYKSKTIQATVTDGPVVKDVMLRKR